MKEELTEGGEGWKVTIHCEEVISFSNNFFPARYEVLMPSSEPSVDVRPGNSKSLLLTSSEVLEASLVV